MIINLSDAKDRKMDSINILPVKSCKIDFHKIVYSIFPLISPQTFGLICCNKGDEPLLYIVTLHNSKLELNVFGDKKFEPYDDMGLNQCNQRELILNGRRILTHLDLEKEKMSVEYWGVGDVLLNNYQKAKVIDSDKKLVLTVFDPLYDEKYEHVINNTYVLTIEDLINKKRIKQIPISTLSGEYKSATNSDLGCIPDVFFGDDFTIYRENERYNWLCVDNSLNQIEHPLLKLLNDNGALFLNRTTSLVISQKNGYAVALYSSGKQNSLSVLAWNNQPSIIPVNLKTNILPSGYDYSMSPSGHWVFFETGKNSGNYLIYLDNKLPGCHLPPMRLDYDGYVEKVTWITSPEGLVVYNDHAFHYWNLADFDVSKLSR